MSSAINYPANVEKPESSSLRHETLGAIFFTPYFNKTGLFIIRSIHKTSITYLGSSLSYAFGDWSWPSLWLGLNFKMGRVRCFAEIFQQGLDSCTCRLEALKINQLIIIIMSVSIRFHVYCCVGWTFMFTNRYLPGKMISCGLNLRST